MKISYLQGLRLTRIALLISCFLFFQTTVKSQNNSVVIIHADGSSGYGVAWGGPQNKKDYIVTALHIVAGKKDIKVSFKGKVVSATIEKIYLPSDLALLKLITPLENIHPLTLYDGDPPLKTNINFWEFAPGSKEPTKMNTTLENETSLAKISPHMEKTLEGGLAKALCFEAGKYYPGMDISIINFEEPNIRKAHSGSPLTYEEEIIGMVDGGIRLIGGKPCVWAIPAADFNKLYTQGTSPSPTLAACDAPGRENNYMYCGIRSDNPNLTLEEVARAQEAERQLEFSTYEGVSLDLYHNYTMDFKDVYETLLEDEKKFLADQFVPGDSITLEHLLNMPVSFYVEKKTGISVAIPAQCKLTKTQDFLGTLNTTTSPGGLTSLSFFISPNEVMDNGIAALNNYKDSLKSKGHPIQPFEEEQLKKHNRYYSEYFENRTASKKGGGIKTVFFANMIVNDGDFLAVSLQVPDWPKVAVNAEEKLFFYLMETCSVLSGFTIY